MNIDCYEKFESTIPNEKIYIKNNKTNEWGEIKQYNAKDLIEDLQRENTKLSNNLNTAYITLKEIIEERDKQKELIDKIKTKCIKARKHNEEAIPVEFDLVDWKILDLIKEYEDEKK